jgi:hypothetical protein
MTAMTSDVMQLDANAYLDPQGRSVQSAERLADAVRAAIHQGGGVRVSLVKLTGAPSSYFNTLFLGLAKDANALDSIGTSIQFDFASTAQKDVFERSLAAVRRSLA